MAGNQNLPTENINEVILGLLKIKSGSELDYQTYFNAIRKRLAAHRMVGAEIPVDEDELLREELKRVGKLKDKGRFKVKKKKIKVASTGPGTGPSPAAGGGGAPPKSGAIIKAPFSGITKDFLQPPIQPVSVRDITDKKPGGKKDKTLDFLERINKTLGSILETLTNIGKQDADERERQRKESEKKKRSEKEKGLESKTFEGIKKAVSTLIKPFQSIWDRIVNFIVYTLLGRAFIKLIDWFADPKNGSKVKSLIRFVTDWWPALLGGYILFGTSFGRLIRTVTGTVGRFIFQIGRVAIPQLLKFIARNPFATLAVAGGIGAYMASRQNEAKRDEFAKTDKSTVKPQQTAKTGKGPGPNQLQREQVLQRGLGGMFSGGGSVKYPKFSGGGFNFKGMIGGASLGAMFGPLGMLIGGAFGSGKPQEMSSGFVSGQKGVDKVPAMLSDGEFVMSVGAVRKYGVETLEAMNAAGGGTNKPKIVNGTAYAAGGGQITEDLTARRYSRPRVKPLSDIDEARRFLRFKTLWHGTNDKFIENMRNTGINAQFGRDSLLGRGFYTTPDKAIADLYAQSAVSGSGGEKSFVKLLAPLRELQKFTKNVNPKTSSKFLNPEVNPLMQFAKGFTPLQLVNKFAPGQDPSRYTGSMYVFGGQRNQDVGKYGSGTRLGVAGPEGYSGLTDLEQMKASNLANKYARLNEVLSGSRIKRSSAPQRWHPSNKPKPVVSPAENPGLKVTRKSIPTARLTSGGGPIGDIPLFNTSNYTDERLMKLAKDWSSKMNIPKDELYASFKHSGIPKLTDIFGPNWAAKIEGGQLSDADINDPIYRKLYPEHVNALEKLKNIIDRGRPQSFTQSSRAASGLDDLARKFDLDAKTAPRYAENLPRLGRPTPPTSKPKLPTFASELSPNYFLRGQSSSLPENYFLRGQSSLLRRPTPPTTSFNRYRPGATIRATGPGMERFGELQRFAGQSGDISRVSRASRLSRLLNNPVTRLAGKATAVLDAPVIGDMILPEGTSEFDQRSSVYNDPRLSPLQRRVIMESVGIKGGGIRGGYGLTSRSFKDMPNTQMMTDPQTGRPIIGYKAMRGGKPVYIRGPQAGAGTKNIWENLGRMINPDAYSDNDARVAMKDQRIAMVNALQSFQAQGMAPDAQARMMKQMGGNLKDVQNDLNYRNKTRVSDQSQRKLNMLSNRGAGPKTGRGQRYTAETRAQTREDVKRGGTWGQITRGLTRMFSDPNSKMGRERIARLDAADKSSAARVKQAGAASINRYYSSSDGKYYKDYDAAVRARNARLAAQQNRKPAVKPPPKPAAKPRYNPAVGGTNGAKGSGSGSRPTAPSVAARHRAGTRVTENVTGTKR